MPKTQVDYSNTIIYKICCKDVSINDIYVGHTTNFIQRKNQHKTSCYNLNNKKYNQYVYEFIRNNGGFENWSMIQIEEHNCKTKRDAEAIEHYWIETLNTNKKKSPVDNVELNTYFERELKKLVPSITSYLTKSMTSFFKKPSGGKPNKTTKKRTKKRRRR